MNGPRVHGFVPHHLLAAQGPSVIVPTALAADTILPVISMPLITIENSPLATLGEDESSIGADPPHEMLVSLLFSTMNVISVSNS